MPAESRLALENVRLLVGYVPVGRVFNLQSQEIDTSILNRIDNKGFSAKNHFYGGLMKTGWSERVREVAESEYIQPARQGRERVEIVVGDLNRKLRTVGFPAGHTNQICTSLESEKFWKGRGLELCSPIGQPRRNDTVFEFRFVGQRDEPRLPAEAQDPLLELAGILKGAIKEGADAFVKELRRDRGDAK